MTPLVFVDTDSLSRCNRLAAQVCGVVNDTGVLLDHLENLESLFAETVKTETARGFGTALFLLSVLERIGTKRKSTMIVVCRGV